MEMLTKSEAYMVIDRLINWAGSLDLQVKISGREQGLTRFAGSEIHQNVSQENLVVELTAKEGKKRATVTTNRLSERELQEAVKEVRQKLEFAGEEELEIPFVKEPDDIESSQYDDKLLQKFDIAGRVKELKKGLSQLTADMEAAGSLSLHNNFLALGNTEGITRYARLVKADFNSVVEKEGQTGYAALTSDNFADFSIEKLFSRAAAKANQSEQPVNIEPKEYPVILEPLAVGGLLTYLSYLGFSARSLQKGVSFLTDRLGEQVFSDKISIYDDHKHNETFKLPFDMEGVPRQKLTIIEKGVARELAYDLKSARKDNCQSTGHSIGRPSMGGLPLHLVMESGESNREEMLASLDRGLLITRFHYLNVVNPRQAIFTGLTRDGTFLIEEGEVKAPVQDLRFTDSLLKAFSRVTAISTEREKVANFSGFSLVPSLLLEGLKFTGRKET